MKKILFLSGSPKKGNTDAVISYLFKHLEGEKKSILLREKNISHCLGCRFCEKNNGCAIKDDMQDITKKLMRADVIILGSPNYFANITGIAKIFIDRLLPSYHTSSLRNKEIILFMPGSSSDAANKKYLLQGTYGFIQYQGMKLLGAYGFCTKDKSVLEEKMEKISKQIAKNISAK